MIKNSLITALFLLICAVCSAQSNPGYLHLEGVINSSVTFTLSSANTPEFVDSPDHHISTDVDYLGEGQYSFSYNASDYIGEDEMIVKYYNPSNVPGVWTSSYITIHISLSQSLLVIEDDVVDFDGSPLVINPLDNDQTSSSDLTIVTIGSLHNCNATLTQNTSIEITEIDDIEELAYVQYVAKDLSGNAATGMITIRSTSYEHPSDMSFVVKQYEDLAIPLSISSYTMSGTSLGSAHIDSESVFQYNSSELGQEIIVLTDGAGQSSFVEINIITEEQNRGFLEDDMVYTGVSEEVFFDVFENDKENNFSIVAYSNGLQHISGGLFSYNPKPFEQGYKNFFYTVYNGFEHQSANITLQIDDYLPVSEGLYQFSSLRNQSYIIDYNVPVTGYRIQVVSDPSYGSVTVDGFQADIDTDCGTYQGNYVIQYTPNTNYYGSDYFELEYCALESNICRIVKVEMAISSDEDDCACQGRDCVWPGDTNNDGVVDHYDVLVLGHNMGTIGPNRESLGVWVGSTTQDWSSNSGEDQIDPKYADANGDGVVSSEDLTQIIENLGSFHGLVSESSQPLSKINMSISTDQDTVYAGDRLFLDIALGNDLYPIVDIQGLAFSLNIDPEIIDSSSLSIDYHDDSWFAHNSPLLDLSAQPQEGHIVTAVSRTNKNAISGIGSIATLGFIVEDDIWGFKLQDDTYKFEINFDGIQLLSLDGTSMQIEDTSIEVVLKIEDKKPTSIQSLVVYPNPADQYLNIYSNMSEDMDVIEMRDINGKLIAQYNNVQSDQYDINTANLQEGIYIITAYTKGEERSVQKIQVLH